MTTQTTGAAELPEALRLAAWLQEGAWHQMRLGDVEAAGRELRRLDAENKALHAQVEALSAAQAGVPADSGDTYADLKAWADDACKASLLPDDFHTHRASWRNALVWLRDHPEDIDDAGYWAHELAAFDRAYAMLAAAPQPSPSPAPAEEPAKAEPRNSPRCSYCHAATSMPVYPEMWHPMETAPKDGTLVRLLVEFEDHATEDGEGPQPTIGSNTADNTGEDTGWQFAGWCWTHDCYTEGVGKPIGWLPMLAATPAPAQPGQEGDRTLGVYCGISPDDGTDPTHPRYVAGFKAGHAAGKKRAARAAPQPATADAVSLLAEARDALWQPSNVDLCERIDAALAAQRGVKP